jgi:hypothetical protein
MGSQQAKKPDFYFSTIDGGMQIGAEGQKGDLGNAQSVFSLQTSDDLFTRESGLFEHR